jgi:LysM repeat protein
MKANRYSFLFSIPSTDYAGWAKGLSKAGYATDPQYAKRLIDIIEKYQLNELDTEFDRSVVTSADKQAISRRTIKYQNDVKYIIANAGDSPASLASQFDVSPRQLIRYNDDIKNENQSLVAGSYVYLQPKRNKYNGHQQYHLMKANEDLVSVSQKYGIQLRALLKRNGLSEGQVPLPNQKITLRGKNKHAIHTADPYMPPPPQQEEPKVINESTSISSVIRGATTTHIDTAAKVVVKSTQVVKSASVVKSTPVMKSPPVENVAGHVVAKGDTLFSIAAIHGLKVEELKKMNNLSVDTIFIGQKLLLK